MAKWWAVVGMALSLAGTAVPAEAGASVAAGSPQASSASLGSRTSVPFGWVDFCNRYAPECDAPALPGLDVDLSAGAFKEIARVNRAVNAAVEPVTDADHWGTVDRWDYPTDGRGDCEDYALEKRKLLMEAGYPRQALLMTVVKAADGEGHAVLTVKTNRGEFVLDNLNDAVKPWTDTGYKFVKRQSQEDPNVWVSVGPPIPGPLYTAR